MINSDAQMKTLLQKPLCMITLAEFIDAIGRNALLDDGNGAINSNTAGKTPMIGKYVYGLSGLASLIGGSVATASRLKKSGVLDAAISQINRKIVIDVDKAMTIISNLKNCDIQDMSTKVK